MFAGAGTIDRSMVPSIDRWYVGLLEDLQDLDIRSIDGLRSIDRLFTDDRSIDGLPTIDRWYVMLTVQISFTVFHLQKRA